MKRAPQKRKVAKIIEIPWKNVFFLFRWIFYKITRSLVNIKQNWWADKQNSVSDQRPKSSNPVQRPEIGRQTRKKWPAKRGEQMTNRDLGSLTAARRHLFRYYTPAKSEQSRKPNFKNLSDSVRSQRTGWHSYRDPFAARRLSLQIEQITSIFP